MLIVNVRIERPSDKQPVHFDGIADNYPAIGELFIITCGRIAVNLGKVVNIKSLKGFLLVQTEDVVAEVWVKDGSGELLHNVVPFARPLKISEDPWTRLCPETLINLH